MAQSRQKLVFYCGYSSIYGNDQNVYGSELALLNLAEQFSRIFDVYVVSESENVKSGHIKTITPDEYRNIKDVQILIISRYLYYFLKYPLTANKTYMWLHDTVCNTGCLLTPSEPSEFVSIGCMIPYDGRYLLENMDSKITGYVVQTEWHRTIFSEVYPNISPSKVHVIGNGIKDSLYNNAGKRVKNRFIYTSSPLRGLDFLLELFPSIRKESPASELFIYRGKDEFTPELLSKTISLSADPTSGIHFMGKVSQEELALRFSESDIWFYPTNYHETFCASAVEAQRSGCIPITSNVAALSETVGQRGILLNHPFGSEKYKEECLKTLNTVMNLGEYSRSNMRSKCIAWAKQQSWVSKANLWYRLMDIDIQQSINLYCDWTDDLSKEWLKLIPENYEYVVESKTDHNIHNTYNAIFNAGPKDLNPAKTIFSFMEPSYNRQHFDLYWSGQNCAYRLPRNAVEWHLDMNHSELLNSTGKIQKTKNLSSFISGETRLPGHKLRNSFTEYIDDVLEYDLYGKLDMGFKNYKGKLASKNDGILPYKYHIAMENGREENYFSEKLVDGILGECLVFYWGCPNIDEWIDSRAIILLPIDNPKKALHIIMNSIINNEYEKRIDFIRLQKLRILNNLSIFPTLRRVIQSRQPPLFTTLVINLDRRSDRWEIFTHSAINNLEQYSRCGAIDGREIKWNSDYQKVFGLKYDSEGHVVKTWKNSFPDHGYRAGDIGCGATHHTIWKNVSTFNWTCPEPERFLAVLEDDVDFEPGFPGMLNKLYFDLLGDNTWDIVYLGLTDRSDELYGDTKIRDVGETFELRLCNPEPVRHHGGGSFGYIIHQRGAKKIIDYLDKGNTIAVPIDWFLVDMFSELRVYKTFPPLVTSGVAKTSAESDIQFCTKTIDVSGWR